MSLINNDILSVLEERSLNGCNNFKTLPNLSNLIYLWKLHLSNSRMELSQNDIKQLKASCGWLDLTFNTIDINLSINIMEITSSSHSKVNTPTQHC